jgi:hypothetical protein
LDILVFSSLRFGLSTHLVCLPFDGQGAFSTRRQMSPSWIIKPIDIIEYCILCVVSGVWCLVSGVLVALPDPLWPDGFKDGVHHGTIAAIPFTTDRYLEAVLA